MELSALIQHCEGLNYADRKKYMVELGYRSRTDPLAQEHIEQLFSGPLYHQLLAVETCHGSHNVDVALRALSAPSRLLRNRAIALIIVLGTDTEILRALGVLPLHFQICMIRRLRTLRRRRQRPRVIDQFLEDLRQDALRSQAFRSLISYGSRNFVDRYLPDVIDQLGMTDWSRLATFQADITKETLQSWALRSKDEDPHLLSVVNQTISEWARSEASSDIALDLVKIMLNATSLSKLAIRELIRRRPHQMVNLILGTEDKLQVALQLGAKPLSKIPVQQLLALQERYPKVVLQSDFPSLTFEQRGALFPILRESWKSVEGVISVDIVCALPKEARISEARRHISLRTYEDKPSGRIPFISLLPWEEAIEQQTSYLRSKEPEIRSSALKWQLQSVKYEDSHLGDALRLAIKRQHEQSPVREAMMEALSKVPACRWEERHLIDLAQILRHALDAGDLSLTCISHMQSLLARILAFYPHWAASQIALIIRERGWIAAPKLPRLAGVIPVKETMEILNTELSPLFDIALEKMDSLPLVTLAQQFSSRTGIRYTREWAGLLDKLEKFLKKVDPDQDTGYGYGCYSIFSILKENRPRTWWLVLPDLAKRTSWMMGLPGIFEHIHVHLQSLLLPYLDWDFQFWPPNRHPLDYLDNGFDRWTAVQQEKFAMNLMKEIENKEVTSDKKLGYIKQLALLSFIDVSHLIKLANDETTIVREAASRALGRLDGDQGMPTLIEALGDDRARIAIYSLRTMFQSISKIEALKLLQSVPMKKVTVAKEVIRLIGDLETNEAFHYLMDIEQTKLHFDVRVALLRAMWTFLGREETWEVFRKAGQDSDPEMAKAVLDIPQDGLSSDNRQSFAKLLLILLRHPSVEVRIAALRKCTSVLLHDPDCIFVPRLFEQLKSGNETEFKSAASVIFRTYSKARPELVGKLFRDTLKCHSAIAMLLDTYLLHVSPSSDRDMDPTTHHVLSILKSDRLSGSLRLKLMFNGLPFEDIRRMLVEIIPELHADHLVLAESLIQQSVANWDGTSIGKFEMELAASKDERARRLALEFLTSNVKRSGGWTDERRQRLEFYRKDESVLVAEAGWGESLPDKETQSE